MTDVYSCHRKFLHVKAKFFLSQTISFCDNKFLFVTRNFFLWHKEFHLSYLFVTGNFSLQQGISSCNSSFFLSQEISSCHRKFLVSQEISSCQSKILPVTGYFFLWQEISSCDKRFLLVTRNFLLWHEIFHLSYLSRFATKCGNSNKNFVWGTQISCHLGCQDARKNPTLFARRSDRTIKLTHPFQCAVWAIKNFPIKYIDQNLLW